MMHFIDSSFPQDFLRNLRDFRDLHFLCDCVLRIETQQSVQNADSDSHTEDIYAHRLVLAATSNFFKELFLLKKDQKDKMTTVNLKLHTPNAVNCFKVILGFLYSGELHLRDCNPKDVYQVAKVCQILALEDQLRPSSPPKILKQPTPAPNSDNNERLDDNGPTPPAQLNLYCAQHKQICCPCRNMSSDGSVEAAYFQAMMSAYEPRSMVPFSPMSNRMTFVPVQSPMVSMASAPPAATLPTIAAAELHANMVHHGYYGPLLPTTTTFVPTVPHSAPAYPTQIRQGFPPMIQMPLNGQQSLMSASTPNSPMSKHGMRSMEGDGQMDEQTPRKTMAKRGMNAKQTQRPSPPDAPFDNLGDIIIPSSEKEGWCRNKKYIERVPNGFMCTVCRKVYGRYNSVSYHVTIYHRNPPIKCDEPGCQFTTREARYIHFHKYYRHHIALPESIDLGSRKCPFCRHVSKSPAMLEKHVSRHMPDCNRVGRMYQCPQCPKEISSQKAMYDHILTHSEDKNYPCDQCNYKGQTESSLVQHVLFKHSSIMFKQKMRCKIDDCNFTSASLEAMHEHKIRVHGKIDDATDNADSLLEHSSLEEEEEDAIDEAMIDEDDDELIDVDGEPMASSDAIITPPPASSTSSKSYSIAAATSPHSFSSNVNGNGNISPFINTSKQPGFSTNSSSILLSN